MLMRGFRSATVAILVAACATSAPGTRVASSAAPVIAAERAFARHSIEIGTNSAFRNFTAPNGQVPRASGIVDAPAEYANATDPGPGNLFWWPAYAGISRSGDLGFTTGPFSGDAARTPVGQYFTVWRRQPDGSWKWLFDGGPSVADPIPGAPDATDIPTLPIAGRGVGSAEAAIAQVSAIERKHAAAASLTALLAPDATVHRAGRPRAVGGPAAVAAMTQPSAGTSFRATRTEASSAGDLVFTLGNANWRAGARDIAGHYVRIWQYRPEGWRIVHDQIMPPQEPPLTPAEIIATERAFSADNDTIGWVAAQRRYAAPGAIVLQPDLSLVRDVLARRSGNGEPGVRFRAAFAAIARGGDFGYTIGSWFIRGREEAHGSYLKVWRRQPDGTWKWIFDGGPDAIDLAPLAADATPPALPTAARGAGSAEAAISEVGALEAQHRDPAALAAMLAPDVRVTRAGVAPAAGAAAAQLFAQSGATFSPLRVEGSQEGDLAFSLGEARWTENGVERRGHYARIWQRRVAGWRIVYDQMVDRAPPRRVLPPA
jgi:ketosteroid isomerase-like protein